MENKTTHREIVVAIVTRPTTSSPNISRKQPSLFMMGFLATKPVLLKPTNRRARVHPARSNHFES